MGRARHRVRMTDAEAETAFKMIRWADTNGAPVCPILRVRRGLLAVMELGGGGGWRFEEEI